MHKAALELLESALNYLDDAELFIASAYVSSAIDCVRFEESKHLDVMPQGDAHHH